MEKIWDKLKDRYEFLCETYGENSVLGVFLYGSQNYGIDNKNSDVDTKAILVPSFDAIANNETPISAGFTFNDELLDVKDIRLMCKMYKKQGINFIETLFTDYYCLNPIYAPIFHEYFIKNNETIAHYSHKAAVISAAATGLNTLKNKSDKPISNKQVATALRLLDFIKKFDIDYIRYSYPKSMVPSGVIKSRIMLLKEEGNEEYPKKDLIDEFKSTFNMILEDSLSLKDDRDFEVDKILTQGTKALIMKRYELEN
jgi:hypothetical protein